MTGLTGQRAKAVALFGSGAIRLPTTIKLIAIAAAMPLIYWLGIAVPYPLAFGLNNPRATWAKVSEVSWTTPVWQMGVYLLLTLLYVAALRLLNLTNPISSQRAQIGTIWLSWVLCCFVLLFASPNGESHDIYDYVFRGRMLDRFAASPLLITPDAYPEAPFYGYVSWKRHVDTYGPLWEYASVATAKMVRFGLEWRNDFNEDGRGCPQLAAACQTLAAYITSYRLLAILLTGFSGLVLYAIIRADPPRLALLGLATWLWNPLLIISSALGAHNDALMLLLVFLTFWLWQQQRWIAGWLALGLAAQVKLTVLLLVPALGLWLVRQLGWLRAIGVSLFAGVVTLGISWTLYAPFGGWATLPRMLHERQLFVANSLAQILYFLLYKWLDWPYVLVWQMMVPWSTWLFVVAAVILLLRDFKFGSALQKANPLEELYRTCVLLILLYLFVSSYWFQSWYLIWVLAPAALWVDGTFPRHGLPWLCFGALCSNAVYDYLVKLPIAAEPEAHLYRVLVTLLVVITIWSPLFVAQRLQRNNVTVKQ